MIRGRWTTMQTKMQLQGVTLDDLDSWVDCQGKDCDAAIDTAEVGHPENEGWLHEKRDITSRGDATVINLCPRCRIDHETEQQTLTNINA